MWQSLCSFMRKRRNPERSASARHRAILNLEVLEGRCLPATRLWIGFAGANWNDATHWADITGAQGVPQTGDTVVFDPNSTYNGRQGTNNNSHQDIADLSIGTLQINPGYNQTISLDASLGVTGTVNMQNGTLGGVVHTLNLTEETAAFNWTGGTISATVNIGNDDPVRPRMNISGNAAKTLTQLGNIENWGTITWTEGNITVNRGALVNNDSQSVFDIQTNADVVLATGGMPAFVFNHGTVRKTQGTDTTTFAADFSNHYQLLLNSGTIEFTKQAYQLAGKTELNGGNLATSRTYYVTAGDLLGVGTILGSLSTDDRTRNGSGTGRVHPGLESTPGTINIAGDYTQTSGGTLSIDDQERAPHPPEGPVAGGAGAASHGGAGAAPRAAASA